ncbi:MAG: dUTP diphosphatase [Acidimicrobiia bacterium]|nr:dUTP diphosphatase [Acidimicrobiia bacterium]
MRIPLQRLDPDLPVPKHARPGDAGVDLPAREAVVLAPGERRLVPTGMAVAIPEGYVGLVAPRSGLALRSGIAIVNAPGIVDSGYRGELAIILVNLGAEPVSIERGDRIAQLVVVPVVSVDFEVVEALEESDRGPAGFGSTGS